MQSLHICRIGKSNLGPYSLPITQGMQLDDLLPLSLPLLPCFPPLDGLRFGHISFDLNLKFLFYHQAIMLINLLLLLLTLQFNIKMSKQNHERPHSPWNSTDRRLQEIMKKYEHSQVGLKKEEKRRPLEEYHRNRMDDSQRYGKRQPWKAEFYEAKTQHLSEYGRKDKGKKLYDSIFFKENHEIDKETKKVDYKRAQKDQNRNYSKKDYKYEQNQPSFYDEKFTFSQQSFANNQKKRRENQLLQAKKYIQQQERKYLRTEVYESSEHRRQRRQGRQSITPQCNERPYMMPQREKVETRSYKKVEYEPRINNIEKINNKIKQILNLNNTFTIDTSRDLPTQRFNRTCLKKQLSPSIRHNHKLTSKTPEKINGRYEAKPLPKDNKLEERSKSCLNLKKKPQIQAQPSIYSQKAEQHIAKFNTKISELAQQKKKLNISFKDYQPKVQNSKTTVDEPLNQSFGRQFNKKIDKLATHVKCKTEHTFDQDFSEDYEETNLQSPYIGLKELQSYCEQSRHVELEGESNRANSFFKKKKQSINNNSHQQRPMEQSKKLLQMLSQQVQLDSKFRQTKNWFNNSSPDPNLSLLQELLCRKWRQMSIEEVQDYFSINYQEEDPFYSYRPDQFQIEDLVANYIICNKHWAEKIEGQWDINKLKEEGFFEKVDLEGKGFLLIEDMVREINMNEGMFFRNRDLFLIFQRFQLQEGERLGEEQMYAVLGEK